MMLRDRVGSAKSTAGLGVCIFLAGCGGTQSISSDELVADSDASVQIPVDTTVSGSAQNEAAAGPSSGDIDASVAVVEEELALIEQLEPTTQLPESQISIEFTVGAEDYRSANGTILEVESTSDDGHYVIGRIDEVPVARISLTCPDEQPADLLVTDLAERDFFEEWIPMVDRLTPSFVGASGCVSDLMGSPTDCLDLPDDPAACIPGEGVEG